MFAKIFLSLRSSNSDFLISFIPRTRVKYGTFLALTIVVFVTMFLFDIKLNRYFKSNEPHKSPENQPETKLNFLSRYRAHFACKSEYNSIRGSNDSKNYDLSQPAPHHLHDIRITRALVINFPLENIDHFLYELKWLYRSWTHMIKFEPPKWRTDLVIFVDNDRQLFDRRDFFLNELNCRFENIRRSALDKPMCTLVYYKSFRKRNFRTQDDFNESFDQKYKYILEKVNVFEFNLDEFEKLYKLMKTEINEYKYLDSILIGFEGYEYFKKAGFDFIIRTDIDVFLTPLFATWLPRHCNDFNVGRGAYSTYFNDKRLRRAAHRLGLSYPGQQNLGSTWYSTPDQIRLVSFLTLFGMVYLSVEEFTQIEREGRLGISMWPEWYYGVLSMYGHTLALNHLIGTNQTNVVVLDQQMDFPSQDSNSIYRVIHIHVFHSYNMFSKFDFKDGKYDSIEINESLLQSDDVKDYALRMALEAKRAPNKILLEMLENNFPNKL